MPFWSAVRYDEADGGLSVGAVELLAGGREVTVPDHGPETLERPGDELRLLAFPRDQRETVPRR